ncbi:centrosomal protein of 95 kDa [Ctenodactylus gundi]
MAGSEAGESRPGAPEEWITVANNLLCKCHINLRIYELEDCDANVFIALYQSILGEKVPDLIAIPKSQEDDAHNVQSVIDSLALDYLQVSLSHITGENIVKGDKESIKNLLEIFDGLLEYLTEHISETSHEKSETEEYFKESHGEEHLEEPEITKESRAPWRRVSFERCSFSSEALGPSWDEDEVESAAEIIRLGDTAHTFSLRSNGTPSVSVTPSATKLGEPIRAAVPLHPPYHPLEPQAPCPIGKEYLQSSLFSSALNSVGEHTAFSEEPDDRVTLTSKVPNDSDQEMYPGQVLGPRTWKLPKGKRNDSRATASSWDSPVPLGRRKALTEQELHAVSEKLSQRLSELDWMLKRALGHRVREKTDGKEDTAGNEEESGSEETLSQHSDSVMECRPERPRPGLSLRRKPPYRSHSLSPSVNKQKQFQTGRKRQRKPKETETRQLQVKVLTEAFERELRRNKVQENIGPQGINEEETVGKISIVLNATGKASTKKPLIKALRNTVRPSRPRARVQEVAIPGRVKQPQVRTTKLYFTELAALERRVNEHSLLPLMLEQFPFLSISGPTLSKMWKQQIAHIEQLKKDACRENRSKKKLQDEIEEALRRHDLLTALVKKEHEHNRRLQDFRDRIQRQRLTQSKIKENRQQTVRARKYYDEYRVQLRAKMMRMRTREEMIFKKLFEEGLQIQKQRLRDLRNYAKEKRDEEKRQHQNELDSMENYYKDQFSLLAEAISQERKELKAREKAQAQTLRKAKRELRSKMEKEIEQLQHMITQDDDDAFFRELEAERFRARLQLASFQYSNSPFP